MLIDVLKSNGEAPIPRQHAAGAAARQCPGRPAGSSEPARLRRVAPIKPLWRKEPRRRESRPPKVSAHTRAQPNALYGVPYQGATVVLALTSLIQCQRGVCLPAPKDTLLKDGQPWPRLALSVSTPGLRPRGCAAGPARLRPLLLNT